MADQLIWYSGRWRTEEGITKRKARDRIRQKEKRAENPLPHRESSKRYADNNKEAVNAQTRLWRQENPDKYRASRRNSKYKRKAAYKETDITTKWLLLLQSDTPACTECGVILTRNNRHLDHIIPLLLGGPHMKHNVRYICGTCNDRRPRKSLGGQ